MGNPLTERTELKRAMLTEIKHQLRYNPRVKGSVSWKAFRKANKPRVLSPLRPMYVEDRRETGRSAKYHAERIEEMALRAELGMDLWGKDEPADTEVIDEELTPKEREFITTVLNYNGDTVAKKASADERRLEIMRAYNSRKRNPKGVSLIS